MNLGKNIYDVVRGETTKYLWENMLDMTRAPINCKVTEQCSNQVYFLVNEIPLLINFNVKFYIHKV